MNPELRRKYQALARSFYAEAWKTEPPDTGLLAYFMICDSIAECWGDLQELYGGLHGVLMSAEAGREDREDTTP
jgi:hypothetical protein